MGHDIHPGRVRASSTTPSSSRDPRPMTPGRVPRASDLQFAARTATLQRKAASEVEAGAEGAVATASTSSGAPLPAGLLEKFEGSLGADLSAVRVHTGGESAAAASAVGARAYALGADIHFNAGEYAPSSADGELLLAHEVAHTVQQGAGTNQPQCKLEVSAPGDHAEVEADRAAEAMVRGAPASVTFGSGVARKVMRKGEGEGSEDGDNGEREGRTQVTPGTSNQSKQATPAQKKQLESLRGSMMKLSGKAQVASTKLHEAVKAATGKLAQIDRDVAVLGELYEKAYKRHARALKSAGLVVARDQAIMNAVINAALGAATGAILPAIAGAPSLAEAVKQVEKEYLLAWDEAKALETAGKAIQSAQGVVQGGGVKAGVGDAGGANQPVTSSPELRQLVAVKGVSSLKTEVIDVATKVIDVAPLDTAIETTLRDTALYVEKGSGTSVSDPVDVVIARAEKLTSHAPAAYAAVAKAASLVGKSVEKVAAGFAESRVQSNVLRMEQRIWVQWIASVTSSEKKKILDALNGGLIDSTLLPDHVVRMLGVERGTFGMGDSDLNQQIANAQRARAAEATVGQTGIYEGKLTQAARGTATVDGSTYSAEFVGYDNPARETEEVSAVAVRVLDTYTFMSEAASTGTANSQSRKRFGLIVKPI
jgi:hypothetical protein